MNAPSDAARRGVTEAVAFIPLYFTPHVQSSGRRSVCSCAATAEAVTAGVERAAATPAYRALAASAGTGVVALRAATTRLPPRGPRQSARSLSAAARRTPTFAVPHATDLVARAADGDGSEAGATRGDRTARATRRRRREANRPPLDFGETRAPRVGDTGDERDEFGSVSDTAAANEEVEEYNEHRDIDSNTAVDDADSAQTRQRARQRRQPRQRRRTQRDGTEEPPQLLRSQRRRERRQRRRRRRAERGGRSASARPAIPVLRGAPFLEMLLTARIPLPFSNGKAKNSRTSSTLSGYVVSAALPGVLGHPTLSGVYLTYLYLATLVEAPESFAALFAAFTYLIGYGTINSTVGFTSIGDTGGTVNFVGAVLASLLLAGGTALTGTVRPLKLDEGDADDDDSEDGERLRNQGDNYDECERYDDGYGEDESGSRYTDRREDGRRSLPSNASAEDLADFDERLHRKRSSSSSSTWERGETEKRRER